MLRHARPGPAPAGRLPPVSRAPVLPGPLRADGGRAVNKFS